MRGVGAAALVVLAAGCASPPVDPSEASGATLVVGMSPLAGLAFLLEPELSALTEMGPAPQGVSLLGRELRPRELAPGTRADFEAKLRAALEERERAPDDELAWVWVGRRLAYLGEFRAAIASYGEGLDRFPGSYRLRRHRGHRHLSVREFDAAIRDLSAAATLASAHPNEMEPDGLPNAFGIPVSSTHGNIHYHLGLAHLWSGDLEAAQLAFESAASFARNDDAVCSSHWWLFVIRKKLGLHGPADLVLERITEDMDVIENHAYHRLLLLHGGRLGPEELEDSEAELYGLSLWHLWRGNEIEAVDLWTTLVEERRWDSFGTISAEVELAARR